MNSLKSLTWVNDTEQRQQLFFFALAKTCMENYKLRIRSVVRQQQHNKSSEIKYLTARDYKTSAGEQDKSSRLVVDSQMLHAFEISLR